MREDYITIIYGTCTTAFWITLLFIITNTKKLRNSRQEILIVGVGCLIFMYVSWITIFVAQINPFIEPKLNK